MELICLALNFLSFAHVLDYDQRIVVVAFLDFEGPELDVLLNFGVGKLAADETLGVEHGVGGVARGLFFGDVTDEALLIVECNIGGQCICALIVPEDFDLVIMENSHARERGAQIDANGDFLAHI